MVRIDKKDIEIFSGARTKDGLLKFSKKDYYDVLCGLKSLVDKHGNTVELEGELSENQELFLRREE